MISLNRKTVALIEASALTGIDQPTLVMFIQREWICPQCEDELDEEDIARIQLVKELRSTFDANDDAISLILHLMDQLYYLRAQMRKSAGANNN